MKQRILTGDRPTGPLHLGHYLGSLKQRVELQHTYDEFLIIADVQALTDNFANPQKVANNITEVALDYLAVGIDPAITTIFIQSQIPEIAELTIFYMNLVNLGRLEQNPTVKTELRQKGFEKEIPVGFLVYPISQAADITAFMPHVVPVGEDQLPMIEQTRDIVRKFNSLYGDTLIEPKELLSQYPRLPGIDGQEKMSKSLGNAIFLSDSQDVVREKVMRMYTDPNRIHPTDAGKVEGNPVFIYHDAFNTNTEEVADLKARYLQGTVGDVEVKEKLITALNHFLDPIRARRAEHAQDMPAIMRMLREGTERARAVAHDTLSRVKDAMHINYFK
jgi:tryptophanyl-tRNA synthetase